MASAKTTPGKFDLVVKKASAGRGLFSMSHIRKGACIIEYTGRPLEESEKYTSRSKYLFDLDNGVTIDGAVKTNLARYINHSCDPNCEIDIIKGRVFVYAFRPIVPGEELNYDYGEDYFSGYIGDKCRCKQCVAERAKAPAVAVETAVEEELALQAAG
jgi:hypothetical protein